MWAEKKLRFIPTDADFITLGVGKEWVPVLIKMGFNTPDELKAANPNKVFNDLGGMRKKLKLEIVIPTKDEVMAWFG